jgi:hypothetical protein
MYGSCVEGRGSIGIPRSGGVCARVSIVDRATAGSLTDGSVDELGDDVGVARVPVLSRQSCAHDSVAEGVEQSLER